MLQFRQEISECSQTLILQIRWIFDLSHNNIRYQLKQKALLVIYENVFWKCIFLTILIFYVDTFPRLKFLTI